MIDALAVIASTAGAFLIDSVGPGNLPACTFLGQCYIVQGICRFRGGGQGQLAVILHGPFYGRAHVSELPYILEPQAVTNFLQELHRGGFPLGKVAGNLARGKVKLFAAERVHSVGKLRRGGLECFHLLVDPVHFLLTLHH